MRLSRVSQLVALATVAAPALGSAQEFAHVTVQYENAPLSQVAQHFTVFTGRTIALGPGIEDQFLTSTARDVPWNVALDQILATRSLVARPRSGGALQIEHERRLNLEYEAAPLSGLLRSIEEFAGRTIVLSEIAGDPWVTVSVRDTDWQRALDRIANSAGLVTRADRDGVFHIEKRP